MNIQKPGSAVGPARTLLHSQHFVQSLEKRILPAEDKRKRKQQLAYITCRFCILNACYHHI